MASLLDDLSYVMRKRIIDAEIVAQEEFQSEGKVAPSVPCYVRETAMILDNTVDLQNAELVQCLCQYDVFASRTDFPSVVSKIRTIAEQISGLFDVMIPANVSVVLANHPDFFANVARPPKTEAVKQEGEIFSVSILIYVNIVKRY